MTPNLKQLPVYFFVFFEDPAVELEERFLVPPLLDAFLGGALSTATSPAPYFRTAAAAFSAAPLY
jgi:hypothetical protein